MQGCLEQAASALSREPVRVNGAGRTDAGVHALGQTVSVALPDAVPLERIAHALNRSLPSDVRVLSVELAPDSFHARYDARSRLYRYRILNRQRPSAIESRFVWHLPDGLDIRRMNSAAARLLGVHDFARFGSVEAGRSSLREMLELQVRRRGEQVVIDIRANAFLTHMARGLVGALVEVGKGAISASELEEATRQPEGPAFPLAPPGGLYLVSVEY